MFDPQEVHGGACAGCGDWFADNEQDLNADDLCADCADAAALAGVDV